MSIALQLTAETADDGLVSLDPLLELAAAAQDQLAVTAGTRGTPEQALARLERGPAVAPILHAARRSLRRELRRIREGC